MAASNALGHSSCGRWPHPDIATSLCMETNLATSENGTVVVCKQEIQRVLKKPSLSYRNKIFQDKNTVKR